MDKKLDDYKEMVQLVLDLKSRNKKLVEWVIHLEKHVNVEGEDKKELDKLLKEAK